MKHASRVSSVSGLDKVPEPISTYVLGGHQMGYSFTSSPYYAEIPASASSDYVYISIANGGGATLPVNIGIGRNAILADPPSEGGDS